MLCAGSVRAKNAKNIILLNLLDACLGGLAWCAQARRLCMQRGSLPHAWSATGLLGVAQAAAEC